MTILQREIHLRSELLNSMGYQIFLGYADITPESERRLFSVFTDLMEINERQRVAQEEAFTKYPWLREHIRKEEE